MLSFDRSVCSDDVLEGRELVVDTLQVLSFSSADLDTLSEDDILTNFAVLLAKLRHSVMLR